MRLPVPSRRSLILALGGGVAASGLARGALADPVWA